MSQTRDPAKTKAHAANPATAPTPASRAKKTHRPIAYQDRKVVEGIGQGIPRGLAVSRLR